jgi:hypothetical protein
MEPEKERLMSQDERFKDERHKGSMWDGFSLALIIAVMLLAARCQNYEGLNW